MGGGRGGADRAPVALEFGSGDLLAGMGCRSDQGAWPEELRFQTGRALRSQLQHKPHVSNQRAGLERRG